MLAVHEPGQHICIVFYVFHVTLSSLLFVGSPKVTIKRPWTDKEKTAVRKRLSAFMDQRRVPGKEDCVQCLKQEKALVERSWKDVKNFVHNTIVTLNRKEASLS